MGCWRGYLSGVRCRLAYVQVMPLPLTVSCFSKIQIGFTFLVPAHLGSPGKRAVKRVCVCACCCSTDSKRLHCCCHLPNMADNSDCRKVWTCPSKMPKVPFPVRDPGHHLGPPDFTPSAPSCERFRSSPCKMFFDPPEFTPQTTP